jgi:hypothetical protein
MQVANWFPLSAIARATSFQVSTPVQGLEVYKLLVSPFVRLNIQHSIVGLWILHVIQHCVQRLERVTLKYMNMLWHDKPMNKSKAGMVSAWEGHAPLSLTAFKLWTQLLQHYLRCSLTCPCITP